MTARREQAAETRARIVEATVALHEEVGPARTTISAIAARAGVERLTVYRHFPDETAILRACSHRWLEAHPPPDAASWAKLAEPRDRTRVAIGAHLGYFSASRSMLAKVYRDADEIPFLRELVEGFDTHLRKEADSLAEAWPARPEKRDALRVVLRHALAFATWRSLEAEGLRPEAMAALLLTWVEAVAGD